MAGKAASPPDLVLDRLRALCARFPGAEEKLSYGAPAFHVRGRLFATFVDNHDEGIAVWCKTDPGEQRARVSDAPDRFFVPRYMGAKGWIGVHLDRPSTDWIDLAILLEQGWSDVAPPAVVRAGVQPQRPPPVRPTTDAARAKAALERISSVCLALPGASVEREGRHATFSVGKKAFAYFLDNHHGDAIIGVCVRAPKPEAQALARKEPKRFYLPAYIGGRGWVGLRVDAARVDWRDVADRIAESHSGVAPKQAAARGSSKQGAPKSKQGAPKSKQAAPKR
jgi:hypothetical protein